MNNVVIIAVICIIIVIAFIVMSRMNIPTFAESATHTPPTNKSGRAPALYQEPPAWSEPGSRELQPGLEYCHLRADWKQLKPVILSHVYMDIFSLTEQQHKEIGDHVNYEEFVEEENQLIADQWEKAYSTNDLEGQSVYFMRPKR